MALTLAHASSILAPVFSVSGTLSFCGSASIVLTGLLFPQLVRGRIYMKMLLMISASDMLGSLAFTCGYVQTPSLCALQGGSIIFFCRAAWFWTLALSYQLYSLVLHRRVVLSFFQLHCLIWTVDLALELLPLYMPHGLSDMADNVDYGTDDLHYGKIVCSLQKKDDPSAANWVAVGVIFVPLCAVLGGLTYLWTRVFFHYKHMRAVFERASLRYSQSLEAPLAENLARRNTGDTDLESETAELGEVDQAVLSRIADLSKTLSLYPLSLFVSWLPLFVLFLFADGFRDEVNADGSLQYMETGAKVGEVVAMGLASLHGTFLSLIFFLHSPEARRHWRWQFDSWKARFFPGLVGAQERDSLLSKGQGAMSLVLPLEDDSVH